MQEVQLYYRRYRGYSFTTANAANAAVPELVSRAVVFKCIKPIEASCMNDRRCRRYSCTWIWYRNVSIQVYEPHRCILQGWHQMQEVKLYYRKYRRYSCTTGDTAVLQQMQQTQLYLILVQGLQYSMYISHRRFLHAYE